MPESRFCWAPYNGFSNRRFRQIPAENPTSRDGTLGTLAEDSVKMGRADGAVMRHAVSDVSQH